MTGLLGAAALAWAEGPRAALARWRDRAADARRAAAFLEVSAQTLADRHRARVPVLNLLGVPLRRSSGGVELQFMARRDATERERPTACLAPSASGWRLEVADARRRARLAFPRLSGEPPADHLARALEMSWTLLAPRGLHVENPAGLDLAVLAAAAASKPLLLSLHDLSLFCPRPHLLPVTADGDCHWTAAGGCALCDDAPRAADAAPLRLLLERARALVFPSAFLRDTYGARFAGLASPRAWVVEPAIALPPTGRWRGTAAIRHVASVGSVQPHKGAALLLALAPALARAGLRVSAYGGGDRALVAALRTAGVETRGYYRAGSLPRRLAADGVDLVLLLSLWPESHSLALDECIAAGVPAVAFDRGALGERLRAAGGVLVDPARGAEGVLAAIAALRAGERTPGPSAERMPTPGDAARAVDGVYRELGWLEARPL